VLSNEKLKSILSNRYLELIIFPTEQCNFRCVYCYEDFSIGKMKPNTVQALKKLISSRLSELDILKISWFGGEPLAAKDIVINLHEFVIDLAKNNSNVRISSGMTTNGFSLNAITLGKLVSLGISGYQISLDGTEEIHNHTCVRLNGGGTFQTIWQNLLAAKQSKLDFKILIRIHLTPNNLEDIYQLIDQLKTTFGNDKRFTVFFKTIENLGGPNTGTFETIRGQQKSQILEQFYNYLGGVLTATKIEDHGPYVCYAAQTNSFIIRADGRIGKCTVALNDDRNTIGTLNDDGTVTIDADKMSLWTRGINSQNLSELKCPYSTMPKDALVYE
jgi:uncharacterized protein